MNFMITTSPNFDQAWLFLSFIKWFMVVSLLLGTSIDMVKIPVVPQSRDKQVSITVCFSLR